LDRALRHQAAHVGLKKLKVGDGAGNDDRWHLRRP
jgi:hypothetical protein